MATLREFIKANRITMRAEWADDNPHMTAARDMDHWKCTIVRRDDDGTRAQMTVYFSQGYGRNGKEPRVCDVLNCLASDASGVENARGFMDWACEYGYDIDSRAAERTYRTVQRQAQKLRRFMGNAYTALLWETERD